MDTVLLARLQFAFTICFHFLFPPISIGLAWLLVMVEWRGWKGNDEAYVRMGKFFAKLLAITFAVGVATGITMEFQFGTNWAEYSKFVGDIFGAPLAAEGVFAFFLESSFLGLYLFGRSRVSKRVHWFSIFMVACGATMSAFWIIVANSWQQTPAGFEIVNGRAVLTSFWAAIFNPSTIPRYTHTMVSALVAGSFFMAGVSAWLVRNGKEVEASKKTLRLSVIFGLVAAVLTVIPTGDISARQVARTQPAKFAALEGLDKTQTGAGLVVVAIPQRFPPKWNSILEIPGLVSLMVHYRFDAEVTGLDAFADDELPNLLITFASFHAMVGLGMLFIALMGWAVWRLYVGKLYTDGWLLRALTLAIPAPLLAIQLGWITAEVGRQPWIVYPTEGFAGMRTADAVSQTVTSGEITFSLLLFGAIYTLLGALWLFLLFREVKHGPAPSQVKEVSA